MSNIIITVGDLCILYEDNTETLNAYRDLLKNNLPQDISKFGISSINNICPCVHPNHLKEFMEYRFNGVEDSPLGVISFHTNSLDEIKLVAKLWKENKYNFHLYGIYKDEIGEVYLSKIFFDELILNLEQNIDIRF